MDPSKLLYNMAAASLLKKAAFTDGSMADLMLQLEQPGMAPAAPGNMNAPPMQYPLPDPSLPHGGGTPAGVAGQPGMMAAQPLGFGPAPMSVGHQIAQALQGMAGSHGGNAPVPMNDPNQLAGLAGGAAGIGLGAGVQRRSQPAPQPGQAGPSQAQRNPQR